MTKIRLGTRGSPLAMWQAHHVCELLRRASPDVAVELVEIQTSGDAVRDIPLAQLGGQGAFTKEIQNALLDKRVDVAVHSLKDLPTFVVDGLTLAAVPQRGPIGDALVSKKHGSFEQLPKRAKVATGSLRRRSQILHRRPDLDLVEIRGNVETRLKKLIDEDLDGLILAEAGLRRLGLDDEITQVLDIDWMLPAVGQGALGLECRAGDQETQAVLNQINHFHTCQCVLAERAMLRGLGGGCHVPIGATSFIENETLVLRGAVLSPDGTERVEDLIRGAAIDAEELGTRLAKRLKELGAERLLQEQ